MKKYTGGGHAPSMPVKVEPVRGTQIPKEAANTGTRDLSHGGTHTKGGK